MHAMLKRNREIEVFQKSYPESTRKPTKIITILFRKGDFLNIQLNITKLCRLTIPS